MSIGGVSDIEISCFTNFNLKLCVETISIERWIDFISACGRLDFDDEFTTIIKPSVTIRI